jgi:hypothetical protein
MSDTITPEVGKTYLTRATLRSWLWPIAALASLMVI